jgi:hypothetical protein
MLDATERALAAGGEEVGRLIIMAPGTAMDGARRE